MSFDPAAVSRYLIRSLDRASLATKMQDRAGEPYVSLVMSACGQDAAPLIYLSDLAVHTQNLRADNRCSLMFDDTYGLDDPLTGKRISVQGKAHIVDDQALLKRYTTRHPNSELYKQFKDFNLFRIAIERVHLVAGFGRIHWIDANEIYYDDAKATDLIDAEADIIAHMNDSHLDAVNLYACKLTNKKGIGWRMTGIDPEGFDMRLGHDMCRCLFEKHVLNAEEAHKTLVNLLKIAHDN